MRSNLQSPLQAPFSLQATKAFKSNQQCSGLISFIRQNPTTDMTRHTLIISNFCCWCFRYLSCHRYSTSRCKKKLPVSNCFSRGEVLCTPNWLQLIPPGLRCEECQLDVESWPGAVIFQQSNDIDQRHKHLITYWITWYILYHYCAITCHRRKFRSKISNNMGRWKEKRRRKKIKKEKVSEEEDSGARKGRKVAKHYVFPVICGSRGAKSRLAKAAGAEPAGQMRDEKLHAVVARSTFRSQNVQNTPSSDDFWKLWCRKGARRCGAKHIWKTHHARTTFGSCDVEKVHAVVARSTFPSQNVKNVRTTFGRSVVVSPGRRKGLCMIVHCDGFCSMSKNDGRRGTFEEDLQRCIFRGRRSTRDMFIRDVTRSGRWFPERGCILEHQIFSFGKIFLRDRCSTWCDLASLFRGRRSALDRWSGKIAKRIGTRPSALHSTFHFWRTSRRIASFLMLSISKIEEVSQNCFVFDVVTFKSWGSLAELLRSWRCQVQKLRKSFRVALF